MLNYESGRTSVLFFSKNVELSEFDFFALYTYLIMKKIQRRDENVI